jgi:hypothetical protein
MNHRPGKGQSMDGWRQLRTGWINAMPAIALAALPVAVAFKHFWM